MTSGHHLIADLSGGSRLDDAAHIEACLIAAATAAGATLLEVRLHSFGPAQGVTGVALLAESHISIHTWPEYGTACVDIFMCGPEHDLAAGLSVIQSGLEAEIDRSFILERSFVAGSGIRPGPPSSTPLISQSGSGGRRRWPRASRR